MKRIEIVREAFYESAMGDNRTLIGIIDTLRERHTAERIAEIATHFGIPYDTALEAINFLTLN